MLAKGPPWTSAGVPDEILFPRNTWSDKDAYDRVASKLAAMFHANFEKYAQGAGAAVVGAGEQPLEVLPRAARGEVLDLALPLRREGAHLVDDVVVMPLLRAGEEGHVEV